MKKMTASAISTFKYKILFAGMINILVVSAMLGIQGAGYLGISLAVFVLFLSFHSLWLSDMVAKYIRGRNARNQYKNSLNFFKGALLYAVITGAVFCAVVILFGNQFGSFLIRDIHIGICLMVIAALLFVQGISEAVNGYLQGMNFYPPVKIFYLVRQITSFVGSIAGMKFLGEYGAKVANLKHNEAVTSVYGAFGALLGMLAGSMTGLILLLVFCLMLHGEIHDMRRKDNARYQESALHGFRVILSLRLMHGIRYIMLFSPLPLNYILYVRLCKSEGDSASWIRTGGFLFGEAVPVMIILLLCFVLLNHKNYRQLAAHWKNEAYSQFREKVFAMLLSALTLALPVCAAVSALAQPILKCLTKGAAKEGNTIMMYAAIAAFLLILETISFRLMELWNETLYLYLTVVVSFGVQTVFAVITFKTTELGMLGILLGIIVQAMLFTVLFFVKFSKRLRFTGNQIKKLVMSLITSLAGALIILLIYQIIGDRLSAGVATAVSMIPGFLLYLAAVTLLRIVSDNEAEYMPGGELFLWLNGLLHR